MGIENRGKRGEGFEPPNNRSAGDPLSHLGTRALTFAGYDLYIKFAGKTIKTDPVSLKICFILAITKRAILKFTLVVCGHLFGKKLEQKSPA